MVPQGPKLNHQIKIKEFELRVPWGHIACKWWGPQNIRPILCLHGWQDNAGSFDRIIPYLPNHLSYLVLDFPGHGLSSEIPHGMIYTCYTFLYVLLFVINKFQWKRVSIMAHSLGAMITYMYASAYPDMCDLIVSLDLTKPDSLGENFELRFLLRGMNELYMADVRNQENTEPPSYSYDVLVQKATSSKMFPVDKESVPFLLYRGIKSSKDDPNKYYFTRDNRLKPFVILIPNHFYEDLGKLITAPFCFIKAQQSYFRESEFTRIFENMNANPYFELHKVDGSHHVHLNDPKTVGNIISKFINKYRPMVVGKL